MPSARRNKLVEMPATAPARIHVIRYQLEWTVAGLSAATRLSRTTLYAYLRGSWTKASTRKKIQAALQSRAASLGKTAPQLWPDTAPATTPTRAES